VSSIRPVSGLGVQPESPETVELVAHAVSKVVVGAPPESPVGHPPVSLVPVVGSSPESAPTPVVPHVVVVTPPLSPAPADPQLPPEVVVDQADVSKSLVGHAALRSAGSADAVRSCSLNEDGEPGRSDSTSAPQAVSCIRQRQPIRPNVAPDCRREPTGGETELSRNEAYFCTISPWRGETWAEHREPNCARVYPRQIRRSSGLDLA
jgi:hypothetical protein